MLAGTGSDVGKSVISTALCRIFLQDGYSPAPFKAQNMSLNSFVTPEGLEIGRAQAVQAEACGLECQSDMNPLLLKPQGSKCSQIVLHGKIWGNADAYDYFRKEGKERLRIEVSGAYDRLASVYNPIVMEGAGSISELNLREGDIVNLSMARHARADVILVGDIDRGGVFASVYGSIALQEAEDKALIKGIIINKFRGDLRLFDRGRAIMEEITGKPVLGVVPYFTGISIEEEDSVSLSRRPSEADEGRRVNVAVVMLRYISNYTDFGVIERDDRLHVYYTDKERDLAEADIIIIPGSKSTLQDLYYLRQKGLAKCILQAHERGTGVIGICGGYQIMGREVADPEHVEGDIERLPGLGLLPVESVIGGVKNTERVSRQIAGISVSGYEIHCGETKPAANDTLKENKCLFESPYATIRDRRTMGTYIHGCLDNKEFLDYVLEPYLGKTERKGPDYKTFKEEQYNRLADHVRKHLDMEKLYGILGT